jgi:hypothetical protein
MQTLALRKSSIFLPKKNGTGRTHLNDGWHDFFTQSPQFFLQRFLSKLTFQFSNHPAIFKKRET